MVLRPLARDNEGRDFNRHRRPPVLADLVSDVESPLDWDMDLMLELVLKNVSNLYSCELNLGWGSGW